MVNPGCEVVAPLNEHSCQVTRKVVESDPTCVLLHNELAYGSEPVLCKRLEQLAVVDKELQDEDLDVEVALWVFNHLK